MNEIVLVLIAFLIFVVIQSLIIVGANDCFKGSKHIADNGDVTYNGGIFYMIAPKFFEKNRHRQWSKPLWGCVKCQSSVWGAITFWPCVIYIFDFSWIEVPIFVADMFMLVTINWYIYNKL